MSAENQLKLVLNDKALTLDQLQMELPSFSRTKIINILSVLYSCGIVNKFGYKKERFYYINAVKW